MENQINEGGLDDADEDGWMAKSQLYKLAKYAISLHGMISDTDNLEPWVQAKITRASEDMSSVKHYLEYQAVNPHGEQPNEPEMSIEQPMPSDDVEEGYEVLPSIDRDKYQERPGLEGPFQTRSGKVVYYDPKEGSYYDPTSDMYISYDDWRKLDSKTMHSTGINMEARSSASDQAAAAGAYNGGKSLAGKGNGKSDLKHKLKGKDLEDFRAKRSAEYDVELAAARKANRERLASYKTEAIDAVLAQADGYSVVKDDGGDIHIRYNDSIIGSASFDGGSDSFWVSTGEAGQESFNTAQDIIDYYAQNKITESSDSTPASILAKYPKEYAALKAGADILDFDDLYYELYVYFVDSGDMPYGTQKARDGDPYEWIQDELDNLGLLEVASVIPAASKVRSQPTQHSLNELDMLAKNIDYIKGPDGKYYKISYRNTGTVTGGGHRQNDKANFVDVQPAGSEEVEALGLDGRLAQPGMNKNQVHIGHDIQGGTPFSDEDISVYAMDTDEYERGVPTGVKTQLLRYMTQKEDSRINANRIEERVKWLANRKK